MTPDTNLSIESISIRELRAAARNPRIHSKKQIAQISESIRTFGFTNPVLIDDGKTILAGHGRVEAAKSLGIEHVPCVRLSRMTSAQKRAYVIADNKLAANAGWDEEVLALEFQELAEIDLGFNIELTGFSTAEIDGLVTSAGGKDDDDPEVDKLPSEGPLVTKAGDLWRLGEHRVLCADSTKSESFDILLGWERVDMVFTDPPHNVRIHGNAVGLGRTKHREFAMASGEMSSPQFMAFLKAIFQNLIAWSKDGSIHYICMDWRHMTELMEAAEGVYTELKNLYVWAKDNGGMGTFYRSQHELVFVFKSGTASHLNNFELGQYGRHRSNVWSYRGNWRSTQR
jgi:hypothetical protein